MSEFDDKRIEIEVGIAREDNAMEHGVLSLGEPSLFTCPGCHGVLLQIKEGKYTRYRCHTGHAFTLNVLLSEVTKSIEDNLWNSLRAMEEAHLLLTHLAEHLREAGHDESAAQVEQKILHAKQCEQLVRRAVMSHDILSEDNIEAQANGGPPGEP